jgi:5'-nucleotidase/UDP-sugar diphosphatase
MVGPISNRAARIFAATLVAAGASIFIGSAPGCGSSTEPAPVSSACPLGGTCQAKLTLLHTSDIHSRLLPYKLVILQTDADLGLGTLNTVKTVGGVARLAYVLGRERARADRVLHLDSGDCFQGAPIFNFFSGEPEVRSQSMMGTDAAVLGNHEFDRGALNVTNQFQRWANFPALAANYKFDDPALPASPKVASVARPFEVFNREGLKIAVIGMANLSSLTSIFDQPNRVGVTPLNTAETAQFYIDLLRPHVDVIVMLSHLGLQVDEDMVRRTTGIDVVLGGHNHIVINPPQELRDCTADPLNPGFVWAVDPNIDVNLGGNPPNDAAHPDPVNHPYQFQRPCKPRNVIIAHSGAFAKYVGRLDLVLSNKPGEASPTGDPVDYDPNNGFEVVSSKYVPFPIDDTVPEAPTMVDLLQPYRRTLDRVADLDILAGYSPDGAKRTAPQGGDSPLGNLIATAMWLRLGIQTDFSLTNTTGIRTDLNPGPISIEEMYNIFPFDNSISKMQLSGSEVEQMFDFVARRSSGRSCTSQAQIAGARVRLNCGGCNRLDSGTACTADADCNSFESGCDTKKGHCRLNACAEQIYIGHTSTVCMSDMDCADPNGNVSPGICDKAPTAPMGRCQSLISPTNLYELATSNYLATGGSGFRVLQRNTTQFDTLIQQRDALIDYLRQGKPCGFKKGTPTAEGLKACSNDGDCASEGAFVCACPTHSADGQFMGAPACVTDKAGCDMSQGRCVLRTCRDDVANVHRERCLGSTDSTCNADLNACSLAGEECKILSCVDKTVGNLTDNRVEMLGR